MDQKEIWLYVIAAALVALALLAARFAPKVKPSDEMTEDELLDNGWHHR